MKDHFKEVKRWLYKNVKLYHFWILFWMAVIAYLLYNYLYYKPEIFQLSTTIITIFVIALTMATSNKELHRAISREITAFQESIEKVTSTVGSFQKFLQNEIAELRRQETERRGAATPKLYYSCSIKHGFVLADCLLNLENKGGYASEIRLVVGPANKMINIGDLGRAMTMPNVNCGRTIEFSGGEAVPAKLYLSDTLGRRYFAQIVMDFNWSGETHIPLQEVT
jgi:hypothetical protein